MYVYIGIALALHIPFMFVVTKIDMAPDNVFQEISLSSLSLSMCVYVCICIYVYIYI